MRDFSDVTAITIHETIPVSNYWNPTIDRISCYRREYLAVTSRCHLSVSLKGLGVDVHNVDITAVQI